MIHRVVLAIFIPLRLKGYLLFHLLPKRLANTDLVAMSATSMRHYYQQWVSIILHVIAAFQDLHKVIFCYLQNTLLILLYLYKSGKVSVEVFIILNLIQFCAGKRCILCSHQNSKKPRVAPEMVIPMSHGYCNLDLVDKVWKKDIPSSNNAPRRSLTFICLRQKHSGCRRTEFLLEEMPLATPNKVPNLLWRADLKPVLLLGITVG